MTTNAEKHVSSELNAWLAERIDYGPRLSVFRVVPDGWQIPDFKPGQYSTLGLPSFYERCEGAETEATPPKEPEKLIKRAYSIASPPFEKNHIEFNITMVPKGTLTPRLWKLKIGSRLFMGPKITGTFVMEEVPQDKHLVFVGTGTGLAPFISMILTYLKPGTSRHFSVFHGVRTSQELAYRLELETLARFHENFHYFPIISRPHEDPIPWKGLTGHVQKLWETKVLEKAFGGVPNPENTNFFLCGSPGMIKDMVELLGKDGFREHTKKEPGQIHIEKYW